MNGLVESFCKRCKQTTLRKEREVRLNPDRCGICAGKIIIEGYNDALSAQPRLEEIWSDKNDLPPTKYTRQSAKKVFINCQKCKQETLRKVHDAVNFPDSCSVCAGKIVVTGYNDLRTVHPTIAEEWSSRNLKKPEEIIASGSKEKAWFLCKTCGQEWLAPVGKRVQGAGCHYCTGQKVLAGFNDLATRLPAALDEWDWKKNGIKPSEITLGSCKEVWWICRNGHSWLASPNARYFPPEKRFHGCNKCARASRVSRKEKEVL